MSCYPVVMFDESPPPYLAVVAAQIPQPPDFPDKTLPFSDSDHLATSIQRLVSEGQTLSSRLKDISEIASAVSEFTHEETALTLSKKFERLIWDSRAVAGTALVAVKDFDEVVLDFLSDPSVAVQVKLKELANVSKLLRHEWDSAKNQRSFLDAFTKELEDFQRAIHSEPCAPICKNRIDGHSVVRRAQISPLCTPLFVDSGTGREGCPSKSTPPFVMPRSEAMNSVSIVHAARGTVSRSGMNYTLAFEHITGMAAFSSLFRSPSPPKPQEAKPAVSKAAQRKDFCPPVEHAKLTALPDTVSALVRDLCLFATRVDVFNTVFSELAREQDIAIVYLKDGQPSANQGFRIEIDRFRRQLPRVCNALDAYSKGRLS